MLSRNLNPYKDVEWSKVQGVIGCTHIHCTTDRELQRLLSEGMELVSFSNYYPSAPYYPLSSIRQNTFMCRQHGYVENGIWKNENIDWNEKIASWKAELSPELASQMPFVEGDAIFSPLPAGVMEVPNAEHHWFSDCSIYLHITAPGATLASGNFDRQHKFQLTEHGYNLGVKVPWREGFKKILDSLMIPDGGGIVIAHPTWSHLPIDFICQLLDSDPRVLGIEVFNHNSRVDFSSYSDSIWDAILSTGRQCYGFFVQDHTMRPDPWNGKIVLLPEERTAESCLRAMRQGRFYGTITGGNVRFDYVNFDGKRLVAHCSDTVQFQLISKVGVIDDIVEGKEFTYEVPDAERASHVFLRLTARVDKGRDKLFTQPFML